MSATRRVVTGHDNHGKSIIAHERMLAGQAVPGSETVVLSTIWGADRPSRYPDDGAEPSHHAFFPPLGGMRFVVFDLAPDANADAATGGIRAQTDALFPGLLDHFDATDPGMHRTATTDMLYVAAGACVLELDDGSRTELRAGDAVVQNGTMHRWSNPWPEPCRIIGLVVGAHHDAM